VSLYRVGKIWYVDLAGHEGRVRESTGTADKAEAQAFHEKRRSELWRQVRLGEKPPVAWGEAVAAWLAVKARGRQDRYRLKAIGPKVGLKTTLPLQEASAAGLVAGMAPGTARRTWGLIAAVHRASGLEPPAVRLSSPPNGRTRWLTAGEWKRLRKALPELHRQMAEFTLATGLRENNVLQLAWQQVDLRRCVAWIHADQAKGGEAIAVPLNDAAVAVLRERGSKKKGWVFGCPEPYWQASNRAWYDALKKAKLVGFRWHDLRHTWASWHVMAGTSLQELMQLGGWKSYSMVLRYSHLSAAHLAGAAAKIKPPVA
jgi:integrase